MSRDARVKELITVRPYENDYQILIGHHRWVAARESGMTTIPVFITEMSDEEAAIALINRQGKEVEPWCEAEHAYVCCNQGYGRNGAMTQQRYAELRGKKQNSISYAIAAYQVKQTLSKSITTVIDFSVRAARDIASLDESDWEWFGLICLEQEWGEKQRQAAIKAIKAISIPTHLQLWLEPQKYKVKAAMEVVTTDSPRIAQDVQR